MLAIARYALKSPYHAATVAGVFAILSLVIPLISILSGAIIGLVVLTQGLSAGGRAILLSLVGITLVVFAITGSPIYGVTIGLVQWLPIVVLAEVLRRTASLSFTLLVGMGLALLAVAIQFIGWPDSEQVWMEFMRQMFGGLKEQGLDEERLETVLSNMVHWMVVLLMATMYLSFTLTLLVARWMQARLADSDGFRQEFYQLRLGQAAAGATLVLAIASTALQQTWLTAMLMVMLAGFMFQGLAIAHSWSRFKQKAMLLFLLYVALIIFPQAIGIMALLGIVDNWVNVRKKLGLLPQETE